MNIKNIALTSIDPRIDFFNQLAPKWDAESNPQETLRRFDKIESLLKLHPGQNVLEIGCGTGQVTPWLAQRVQPGRLVAADFSPEMLAQAKSTGAMATYEILDICQRPSQHGPFDMVLCFNAFPHFRDKAAALSNIVKSLNPAGTLTVLHFAGREQLNAFHGGLRAPVCHDMLPDKPTWLKLLQQAGMKLACYEDKESLFLLQATISK